MIDHQRENLKSVLWAVLFLTPREGSTIFFYGWAQLSPHSSLAAVIANFLSCLPDDLWTPAGLWTMTGRSQTTIQYKNKIHKAIYESFGKLYASPSGGSVYCRVLNTSLSLPFSICLIVPKMSSPVSHPVELLEKVTVATVCWCIWCRILFILHFLQWKYSRRKWQTFSFYTQLHWYVAKQTVGWTCLHTFSHCKHSYQCGTCQKNRGSVHFSVSPRVTQQCWYDS